MPSLVTRPADTRDADAVAAIYNEGIAGRGATFETSLRTAHDVRAWFDGPPPDAGQDRPITYPFLVAEDEGGEVCGWVRASPYRARACYAGIADFSVYVASAAHGRGVGHALMAAFLPACQAAGLWKMLSRIFPENAASLALCARHGFREVGTYHRHAQLDGVWRDVVIVERGLE